MLAHPSYWRIHPKAQREALREVLDTVGYVAEDVLLHHVLGLDLTRPRSAEMRADG
jgi:hypothetical protein